MYAARREASWRRAPSLRPPPAELITGRSAGGIALKGYTGWDESPAGTSGDPEAPRGGCPHHDRWLRQRRGNASAGLPACLVYCRALTDDWLVGRADGIEPPVAAVVRLVFER